MTIAAGTAISSAVTPRQPFPALARTGWAPKVRDGAEPVGARVAALPAIAACLAGGAGSRCGAGCGGRVSRHLVWQALQKKRRVPFSQAATVRLVWVNCAKHPAQVNRRLAGPRDICLGGTDVRLGLARNKAATMTMIATAAPRPAINCHVICIGMTNVDEREGVLGQASGSMQLPRAALRQVRARPSARLQSWGFHQR